MCIGILFRYLRLRANHEHTGTTLHFLGHENRVSLELIVSEVSPTVYFLALSGHSSSTQRPQLIGTHVYYY